MEKDTLQKITPAKLIGLLHRTTKALSRSSHQGGRLHHAKLRVMMVLSPEQEMSQHDLLNKLKIRASSLSEVLSKLEEDGLVERTKDASDRRAYTLHLTDKGRKAYQDLMQHMEMFAEIIFADFSDEEQQELGRLLKKLLAALKAREPAEAEDPLRRKTRQAGLEPFARFRG